MRFAAIACVLAVVLAGCVGGAGPKASGTPGNGSNATSPQQDDPKDPAGTPAPDLVNGTTFTYEADGVFNPDGSFTVVVRHRDAGYLFAGAGPADLVGEVVWGRVWFGPQDAELDPVTDEGSPSRLFDFPLRDGKTWDWAGREDWPVVARAADVPVPGGGTEPGFEMTMESGDAGGWTWTYAPSVGYVTRLTSTGSSGTTYYDLTLTSVGTAEEATWFDARGESAGECAGGDEPAKQTTLSVSDADAVVVSTGFAGNGSAAIQPPPTSQMGPVGWLWTSPDEDWSYQRIEAADGDWTLGAASNARYACIFAQAVTWIDA